MRASDRHEAERAGPRGHLVLALAAIALALLSSGCGRSKDSDAPGATAEAAEAAAQPVSVIITRRGTIQEELELTGTCDAEDELDIVPEVAGKVIHVAVDVGDAVRKGQALVRLDTTLVSKQRVSAQKGVVSAGARLTQAVEGAELTDRETVVHIAQAQEALKAAREQVRKAEAGYKLTAEQVEGKIKQAKVGLASAEAQQRDVVAGVRAQEIAQAQARVRQAESDLALKKSNYERYRRLYEQGAVAEATLDGFRTQYEVAQQAVTQAREALSLAREGARQEQRRLASLGVDNAREQLRIAESGRRQIEIAARDIDVAKAGVRQAEEALRLARAARRRYNVSLAGVKAARAGVGQATAGRDLARATEGKYTVYSPIHGLVARRNVDIGEGASPAFPVMRIVNSNPIRVNCQVSELDIHRVKLGDDGVTTIDGLPEETFFGRVVAITPQALKDQRNYIARVEIENPGGIIKAGMFARVKLVISEKHDVIVVTRDALVERGKERQAYVVENGAVKIRKVKTGVTNGRDVEVVSGVRAGEYLVASGHGMLAEGQKVKPVPVGRKQKAGGKEPSRK